MRLLFFVEPFPVRGRPTDFQWVLDRWVRLARGLERLGVHSTFAVADAVAQANPELGFEVLSPSKLGAPPPFPAEVADQDRDWVEVMENPASPWSVFTRALFERVHPDAVLSWTVNAGLREEARRRRVPVLHQELGPVRFPAGPLYFCDPRGVNGRCAVQELWPEVGARPLEAWERAVLGCLLDDFVRPSPEGVARQRAALPSTNQRTLLVVLQVPRDSNLLAWARVKGNEGLLHHVAEAVDRERWRVVIKRHPSDPNPPPPAELGTLLPDTCTAAEAIELSDAVVTINSSVGLEALSLGRPVLALGKSVYSGVGCTRDLDGSVEAFRAALEQPRTAGECESAERLLWFLFSRYLATEAELSGAPAMLARLEHARALAGRDAPALDYFPPRQLAWLHDLEAQRERLQLSRQLAQANAALPPLRDDVVRLSQRAQQAETELEAIRGSAAYRAADALRRVPGLYRGYLEAKSAVQRLRGPR